MKSLSGLIKFCIGLSALGVVCTAPALPFLIPTDNGVYLVNLTNAISNPLAPQYNPSSKILLNDGQTQCWNTSVGSDGSGNNQTPLYYGAGYDCDALTSLIITPQYININGKPLWSQQPITVNINIPSPYQNINVKLLADKYPQFDNAGNVVVSGTIKATVGQPYCARK